MANMLWVKGTVRIAVAFVGIVKRTAIGVSQLTAIWSVHKWANPTRQSRVWLVVPKRLSCMLSLVLILH
jgi:hypothetical protein